MTVAMKPLYGFDQVIWSKYFSFENFFHSNWSCLIGCEILHLHWKLHFPAISTTWNFKSPCQNKKAFSPFYHKKIFWCSEIIMIFQATLKRVNFFHKIFHITTRTLDYTSPSLILKFAWIMLENWAMVRM